LVDGAAITTGTAIAGRSDLSLEDLVGFFVNTLLLRIDVSGNPTFAALLGRVRAVDLAAYEHQDLPFEQLVDALQPSRSLGRHPLFQVMLTLQNAPPPSLALRGLRVRPEALPTIAAKFDLTFDLGEQFGGAGEPAGVDGTLTYRTDLFEHTTAAALAERWIGFLDAAARTPDVPLTSLAVLTTEERDQLLAWTSTVEAFDASPLPLQF